MKVITICYENTIRILHDDDDTDLKEYINQLSKILESNNIIILELSGTSIILKPNKITSIEVEEQIIKNPSNDILENPKLIDIDITSEDLDNKELSDDNINENEINESEDYITDGD